ncbi:uncharacterized protein LOC110922690 isoform X2 [Helianthus annuus]|uniref:uncharacterized protein LOC110922690 isoform X2 n=1 Tax=Helianthus annuus TaxID=4232 RepID=UPI000B908475|nr:uncharacterized protein LOC110922690 isoform X2 [Helianthus annuus]
MVSLRSPRVHLCFCCILRRDPLHFDDFHHHDRDVGSLILLRDLHRSYKLGKDQYDSALLHPGKMPKAFLCDRVSIVDDFGYRKLFDQPVVSLVYLCYLPWTLLVFYEK